MDLCLQSYSSVRSLIVVEYDQEMDLAPDLSPGSDHYRPTNGHKPYPRFQAVCYFDELGSTHKLHPPIN